MCRLRGFGIVSLVHLRDFYTGCLTTVVGREEDEYEGRCGCDWAVKNDNDGIVE